MFLAGGTRFRGGCSSKMFCLCRLFLRLGLTSYKVCTIARRGCFHFALFLAGGTHFIGSSKMFCFCRLFLQLGLTLKKVAWHNCFHFVHFALFLAGGTHFRGGCSSKMLCVCRLFLHLGLTLESLHDCMAQLLSLCIVLAGGTHFRGGCSSKMFSLCCLFLHLGLPLGKFTLLTLHCFWQVGLTLEEAAARRCFVFVVCSCTWDWL